jgi:hypothetical protein
MTSKIKVDNINKVSDDTNIIKKCGTTTTIGSGASNPIVVDGSAVTLGRCGGTVALASGATQTGFGRTGTVDWQTSSIKTSTFTAANGEGYFANTSGGAFTMNLPAGTAGNIVSVVDYTNTFQTNNLTISPNGSQKIGGVAATIGLSTEGQSVTLVYVDDTEGWKNTMDSTSNVTGNQFIVATGGTITNCGGCKIHTFTGPGTFTVSQVHPCAANNLVSYMVVAGGGGGGGCGSDGIGGGGGAGGYRETKSPVTPYVASPLDGYSTPGNRITVTATAFPIAVGSGGAKCNTGSVSTFSSITSAGGGKGGLRNVGSTGGSGGGGGHEHCGSAGNTPPVTPPQGNAGGAGINASPVYPAGGGGGAAESGNTDGQGQGGDGVTTLINGSPVTRSGGGGGGVNNCSTVKPGGDGGGGTGGNNSTNALAATANTGGGGGGAGGSSAPDRSGGAGGSGVVIIRYKFQ